MDKKKLAEEAMQRHAAWHGKIEVVARCQLNTREDLALAYTPGVAAPCLAIQEQPELSFTLTRRSNLVAVVTDGTAVLGLGDIGPEAGMPVMEGKCALFKAFADVDAFPLCIRSKDPDEIVRTVSLLAGSFGGINLEDIAAPRCFEIERRLQEVCDIPVFHDDQHGTAVVVAAALLNALRVVGKDIGQVRTVISGAGAAGISIGRHLLRMGVRDLTMVDRFGALYSGKPENNPAQEEMAALTNPRRLTGDLADCLRCADVFVGVSAPGIVSQDMVRSMAPDAIVFPMANPVPEILPELALEAGARIVGSGRSDYPNQINNVLAFPGIFRGALDCRATCINEEMKAAASQALAAYIPADALSETNIIPSALDRGVARAVADAVIAAARASGVARA